MITTANLTGAVSALTNALKTTHNAGDFIMAFTSKLPVVGPWLDLGYTILGLNAPQPQGPSYFRSPRRMRTAAHKSPQRANTLPKVKKQLRIFMLKDILSSRFVKVVTIRS